MRTWMQFAARSIAAAGLAILAGCAHPILIATDKSAPSAPPAKKIDRNVAFVMPDALLAKEVITPGGGGDKVSYLPYRDLELPLYATLSNVFASTTKLRTANDSAAIQKGQVSYILTPEITTDSASDSAFTWPPTRFTVNLTCTVTDLNGTVVWKKTVVGQGNAEFSEFKRNFSLSAQRASEDVLKNLQEALTEAPEFHGGAIGVVPLTGQSAGAASQGTGASASHPVPPSAGRHAEPAATARAKPVAMDGLRYLLPPR